MGKIKLYAYEYN